MKLEQESKSNLTRLVRTFPEVFAVGAAAQTAAMGDLAPMYAGRVISGLGVGLSEFPFRGFEARRSSDLPPLPLPPSVHCLSHVCIRDGTQGSSWKDHGSLPSE